MSFTHDEMKGRIYTRLTWAHMPRFQFHEESPNKVSGEPGSTLTIQQPFCNCRGEITHYKNVFNFVMEEGRWRLTRGTGGITAFKELCGQN